MPKTVILTTVSVSFFFISNFTTFQLLKTMLAIYGFHSENIFWRKLCIKKTMQFEPFCFIIKRALLRRQHRETKVATF